MKQANNMTIFIDYINLTNGIQALPAFKDNRDEIKYLRIQSTWCEQQRWNDIILQLSDDLLLHLALGHYCVVHDYSNKRNSPRAIWQGLEVVKYILYKYWFQHNYKLDGRAERMQQYVEEYEWNDAVISKLKYFKKYINTSTIHLHSITGRTIYDGDYTYYFDRLTSYYKNSP